MRKKATKMTTGLKPEQLQGGSHRYGKEVGRGKATWEFGFLNIVAPLNI